MLASQQIEALICLVSSMDKSSLVEQLQLYPSRFPLDFTPTFLEESSVERLRHIFVAICLQCQKIPQMMAESVG